MRKAILNICLLIISIGSFGAVHGLSEFLPNLCIYTGSGSQNFYSYDSTTGQFTAHISIQNNGTADSGPFRIGLYLSSDSLITTADILLSHVASSLAFGYHIDINIKGDGQVLNSLPPGIYYLGVYIDDLYQVTESNESDNSFAFPVPIPHLPCLHVNPDSLIIYQPEGFLSPASSGSQAEHVVLTPLPGSLSGNHSGYRHVPGIKRNDSEVAYWRSHKGINYPVDRSLQQVDWSIYDSPVKDQGVVCGSCWAFASTALVENLGRKSDLSEQFLISCSQAGSCVGGSYLSALQYYKSSGVPEESCYPYYGINGNCDQACNNPPYREKLAAVSSELWGLATVDILKAKLQEGPLVASMLIPQDGSFDGYPGYSGGIYHYSGDSIPAVYTHAILIVGYNDVQGCFKAKNSWGAFWGEDGYFRVSYEDVTNYVEFGSYAVTGHGAYAEHIDSNSVILTNTGQAVLTIDSVYTDRNWLEVSGFPSSLFQIQPGDTFAINISVHWNLVGDTARLAHIWIVSDDPGNGSTPVSVTAQPVHCNISCYPGNQTAGPSLGTIYFTVDISEGCGWTASSDQAWCLPLPSGTGPGQFPVNYTGNNTGKTRMAGIFLSVNGHVSDTVTLTQTADPCMIISNPASVTIKSDSGSVSFELITQDSCEWVAGSDQDWCGVTRSGKGHGTITASYTRNLTGKNRMALITVQGSSGGPVIIDTLIQQTANSITEPSSDDFRIFPNPARDQLAVESEEARHQPYRIEIFNGLGKNLTALPWADGRRINIDLSALAPGFYVMRISTEKRLKAIRFLIMK